MKWMINKPVVHIYIVIIFISTMLAVLLPIVRNNDIYSLVQIESIVFIFNWTIETYY